MKNDFDFIKEKFEADGVASPSQLDTKIVQKLDGATPTKLKLYQRTGFKVVTSLVACIAVFISVLSIGFRSNNEPTIVNAMDGVSTFESYGDLQKYIENNKKHLNTDENNFLFNFGSTTSKGDTAVNESTDSLNLGSSSNSASTYIQELGVDEADIIKTVGNYVYFVSNGYWDNEYTSGSPRIFVFKIDGKTATKVNDIRIKNGYIDEIFVANNVLTVIYNLDMISDSLNDSKTMVDMYDVSNPEKLEKISTFTQSGWYSSSRMIGDTLYLVTNKETYYQRNTSPEEYIPYTCKNSGEKDRVKCDSITYPIGSRSCAFTVISAVDTKTGEKIGATKAMLGWGSDVYCSQNNLYLYCGSYDDDEYETLVAKIDLNKELKVSATGRVKGEVNSQYSFSEKDNHLCVFTTVYGEMDSNYLYVLNDKLENAYTSKAFAKTESIKAVKYIGDYAYVITYEQTDPLFIIDLTDVEHPVFKGEVKISGFSQMLVDVGNHKLLGIGTSTHYGEEVEMEVDDGLKFALFDVSNPSNPRVMDAIEYKDTYSEAQLNPKAMVQNLEKGYFAVPTDDGAIVVAIEDGEIVEKAKINLHQGYSIYRVTYVDNNYFLVDLNNATISYFEV